MVETSGACATVSHTSECNTVRKQAAPATPTHVCTMHDSQGHRDIGPHPGIPAHIFAPSVWPGYVTLSPAVSARIDQVPGLDTQVAASAQRPPMSSTQNITAGLLDCVLLLKRCRP